MKVCIVTYEGTKHSEGEWDGKRVDGVYARVNNELYPVCLMVAPEKIDQYVSDMKRLKEASRLADKAVLTYQIENGLLSKEK